MAILYERPRRRGRNDLSQLNLGKIFIKPTQGIFGIRRAGRPKWDAIVEEAVLKKIRGEAAAKGIASHCLGKRGQEFFNCLREQALSKLAYAGKSGLLWAIQDADTMTAEYALEHRFISSRIPDSAMMNGRRIVHYVLAGEDIDTAVRNALVQPKELFDENIVRHSVKPENLEKVMAIVRTTREKWKQQIPVYAEDFARKLQSYPLSEEEKNKLATINRAAIEAALNAVLA